MGDKKKGEGGGRSPTTGDVASQLVRDAQKEGIIFDQLTVLYVTEGLYAVTELQRGASEPERYFLRLEGSTVHTEGL